MSRNKRLPTLLGGLGAIVVLGAGASFAVGGQPDRTREAQSALHGGKAKNVIFFLGDGMGDSEVTSARYYQYGAAGRLNLDRLPLTGFQTTWSVKPAASAPYKPDYDPDSASTGTMWATGEKTIDERISQGPSSAENVPGKNLQTILERAQKQGKRTGNVSTAEITDATPGGAQLAHLAARLPGPAGHRDHAARRRPRRRAGSARSPSRPSITGSTSCWAAAARRFQQTVAGGPDDGKTVEQYAQDRRGYTEVTDAAGLAAARRSDRPLLGLFAAGQHGDGVERAAGDPRRRHAAAALRDDQPAGEPAEPARDDAQGDRPARGRPRRLLPAGRGRLDRQAGPRRQRVRADRRDDRVRQRDRGRAGVRAPQPRHADRRHRRSRAHEPDRGRGLQRHGQPDGLLEQPRHG